MRALIVEDDPLLSEQLVTAFQDAGFVTDRAADGAEGEFLGATEAYDVAILDPVSYTHLTLPTSDLV